ncbi:MAG: LEA type 2 family protein [Desulfobulbales bacterium]
MNSYHRHLIFPLLALPLLLTFIAGCAGSGRLTQSPRVTLADIQLQEIKTLESAFLVELRVLNPNDRPLEVSGIECDLKIDGNEFAAGVSGDHHVIPAYGSAIVPVTIYASMLDMVSSVMAFVQGSSSKTGQLKPLRYRLSGHVRLGGIQGLKKNLPFESTGELSLDGAD